MSRRLPRRGLHANMVKGAYCVNTFSTYSKRPPRGLYSAVFHPYSTYSMEYAVFQAPKMDVFRLKIFFAPRIHTVGLASPSGQG